MRRNFRGKKKMWMWFWFWFSFWSYLDMKYRQFFEKHSFCAVQSMILIFCQSPYYFQKKSLPKRLCLEIVQKVGKKRKYGLHRKQKWHKVAHRVQNLFCLLFSCSKHLLQVAPSIVGEKTAPSGCIILKFQFGYLLIRTL